MFNCEFDVVNLASFCSVIGFLSTDLTAFLRVLQSASKCMKPSVVRLSGCNPSDTERQERMPSKPGLSTHEPK